MDRMAAIERVTEGLMLLREGSHNVRRAGAELTEALELLQYKPEDDALDDRERQVLEFLATWEGARSPTFQQVAEGCDYSSREHARQIVIRLADKGFIARSAGRARSITVLKTGDGQPVNGGGSA